MLDDPTAEREVLGDIGWQRNEVVLHSDPRLPRRAPGRAGITG
jgi:predicted NAD/FAD-binding protein